MEQQGPPEARPPTPYEQAKAKLEAEFGADRVTAMPEYGGIVCKPAKLGELNRFTEGTTKAVMGKGGTILDAERRLVLACVVYPGRDELSTIFEDAPGIISTLANGIQGASGGKAQLEGN